MNTSATLSYDWNTMQRRLIRFGIENHVILDIHHGENTQILSQQELKKKLELKKLREVDDGWRTLDPWASTNFNDVNIQLPYRQNLILKDGDKVILQRMGVHTFDNYSAQKKAEEKGRELFGEVQRLAIYHQENTGRSGHPIYHFGIWTDRVGQVYITKDTRQDKTVGKGKNKKVVANEDAANAVMEFVLWYRKYVDNFVYPLVKSSKYGISPSIKEVFNQHKEAYKWLLDQEVGPAARHICHEMFSTFSPFPGFSSNMHPDDSDTEFSFLINFGAKCLLSLGPYKLKVDLQPFDVVFFNTKIPHMTEAKEADIDKTKRWAISGYMRQCFLDQLELDDRTAAEAVTARAVAMERE